MHEHSGTYAGIANVLVNNPAIYERHVYYIIKNTDESQRLLPAFAKYHLDICSRIWTSISLSLQKRAYFFGYSLTE